MSYWNIFLKSSNSHTQLDSLHASSSHATEELMGYDNSVKSHC